MKLLIGNKNYSSWSMRPWVLLTEFGIPFEEVLARFDSFAPDSAFKATVAALSPAGKVPILVADDGLAVWDTLAIAEYLAESHPDKPLWPRDAKRRARARSVCAEMHSGFGALRSAFGMNIEASLPEVGARVLADNAAARADLARMIDLWTDALAQSGGPFLFGDYAIPDAYFAPVAMRIRTYALPVPPVVAAYVDRLVATRGVSAWIADALQEKEFLPFEEAYRTAREQGLRDAS
jgi:glutathione S-transferase